MKVLSAALVALFVALLAADPVLAKLPGFGHMDGVTGGGGRRGGTKTGDYNDSNDPNAAAGAQHDGIANDPNAGINKGVKDEVAGAVAAMDAAQKKVEKQFESSSEWTDAAAEYDKSKAAYEKARSAALASLKEKPEYQTAVATSDKAAADLSELRKSGAATPEQLFAAAATTLRAQAALTKMQSDACAANPDVTAAKPKLTDAAAAMKVLREKEHAAVLADADWQAAKQKYDAVKVKTATAKK